MRFPTITTAQAADLPALAPAASAGRIKLRLLGEFPLYQPDAGLNEPSGLSMDAKKRMLWTVSDDTRRLFRLDFMGRLDAMVDVAADELEGIAAMPDGNFVVVREATNEILIFDGNGAEMARRKIKDMDGYGQVERDFAESPEGKGLEGVTADAATGTLFVLKEGRPRLLLAVASDLSEITDVHRLTRDAGFRVDGIKDKNLDVSGIAHDSNRRRFWIVSDTGSTVFLYDAEARVAVGHGLFRQKNGKKKALTNAEGVALHPDGDILFVVTDNKEKSKLLAYQIVETGG